MRVAILSDIHGNAIALDAVLDDLRRETVEQIVCLGDAVQGGAQPKEVVERLRALACPVVMGNADDFLLTGTVKAGGEPASDRHYAVREWQLAQLSPDDLRFIETFKPTVTLPLREHFSLLCFHGSPASFDDIILPSTPDAEVQRLLGAYQDSVLTGGHTHLQQIRRIGNSFFFNPGSVGFGYSWQQPKDEHFRADPWAEYAILTSEERYLRLEFRRVTFDVDAWVRAIRASGKPDMDWQALMYEGRK
jgi:putative phosphoesterase